MSVSNTNFSRIISSIITCTKPVNFSHCLIIFNLVPNPCFPDNHLSGTHYLSVVQASHLKIWDLLGWSWIRADSSHWRLCLCFYKDHKESNIRIIPLLLNWHSWLAVMMVFLSYFSLSTWLSIHLYPCGYYIPPANHACSYMHPYQIVVVYCFSLQTEWWSCFVHWNELWPLREYSTMVLFRCGFCGHGSE